MVGSNNAYQGNKMILALTAIPAGLAVGLSIWFAVSSARNGTFGFHHLQWLAMGVLIMTGFPMLMWDWEVLTVLFGQAGMPHPAYAAAWAASVISATAAALVLRPPRSVREALCGGMQIPCS